MSVSLHDVCPGTETLNCLTLSSRIRHMNLRVAQRVKKLLFFMETKSLRPQLKASATGACTQPHGSYLHPVSFSLILISPINLRVILQISHLSFGFLPKQSSWMHFPCPSIAPSLPLPRGLLVLRFW
jgi:hypothetical protein